MNKAPDAFRTISEVADDLDIPQHVLRFWESRFPQVKPMKRGGGRRYYRPDDVDLLRGIRHLLYGEGYTIRGVQRILREQGARFVQSVWQEGAPQPRQEPGDREADADETAGEGPREAATAARAGDEAPDGDVSPFEAGPDDDAAVPLLGFARRTEGPPLRREPTFAAGAGAAPGARLKSTPHGVSDLPAPSRPSPPPGLSPADRERLRAVLDDLVSCRRILAAAERRD